MCPGLTYLKLGQSAERNPRVMSIPINWINQRNAIDELRVTLVMSRGTFYQWDQLCQSRRTFRWNSSNRLAKPLSSPLSSTAMGRVCARNSISSPGAPGGLGGGGQAWIGAGGACVSR
eukprot:653567-Prorocentrum_minimum.AAC.1